MCSPEDSFAVTLNWREDPLLTARTVRCEQHSATTGWRPHRGSLSSVKPDKFDVAKDKKPRGFDRPIARSSVLAVADAVATLL